MITFKKVRYKNLLSTGNQFTEIDLCRSPTTLVVGANGAGKSTVLDALSFGLFNTPHRDILKPQLVNSVNERGLEVEVEFKIGPDEYMVRRGLKPRLFEIHKNGALINQDADSRDYQAHLEQVILGMTHKSFHQIVVLGSSSFVPFMQLPPKHRRAVIEDLLDINVFTRMNQLLKIKTANLKERHRDVESQLEVLKAKAEVHERYVAELAAVNRDLEKKRRARLKEVAGLIENEVTKAEALEQKIDAGRAELRSQLRSLRNREHTMAHALATQRKIVSDAKAKMAFFKDNAACPTCDQCLDEAHARELLERYDGERLNAEVDLAKLEEEAKKLTERAGELRKLETTIDACADRAKEHRRAVKTLEHEAEGLREELARLRAGRGGDAARAKAELMSLAATCKVLEDERLALTSDLMYAAAEAEMLKDGGIKAKVIERYLPVMNTLINQYLQTLDFFVNFELNETFQETIKSRHQDIFSYSSFSEGEKQRLDLAILFMFRQVARMKNSVVTNLLILDETFDSSLDADGIDNLLKILETLEAGTNVFVISHKRDQLDSKFPDKLVFEKIGNYSVVREE